MLLRLVGCKASSFMSLLPKPSSQPCLLMRLDLGVSNTLKEERKLGEAKSKGHSALSGELKQSHFWLLCVSSRVRKKHRKERVLAGEVQSKKIERNMVRV